MQKSKNKNFKNREKLIETALEEFSNHSFKEASLNNIIKKAGVSKGSFYFHFKDKKALYLQLFDEIGRLKKNFIMEQTAENPSGNIFGDFFEILKESAASGIQFALKYPNYNKLAMNFFKEKGSRIYDEVKKRFSGDFESIIKTMVEKAIKEGQIRDDFDSKFLTDLLLNFDALFPYEKLQSFEEIMQLLDKYMDFLKFGLASREKIHETKGNKSD